MGVGRTAPHRVRAAYARALAQIPLPVRSVSAPVPEVLTVLGQAEIGDRIVQYGTMTDAPKLWVAFPVLAPPVFGYLTGLVSEEPQLRITDSEHLAWSREPGHTEALLRHGLEVWREARRCCEG